MGTQKNRLDETDVLTDGQENNHNFTQIIFLLTGPMIILLTCIHSHLVELEV